MKQRTLPELYAVKGEKISACLLGWGKPRILVTEGAFARLSHEQADALVGHELGHHFLRHYEQRLLFLVCCALALLAAVYALDGWWWLALLPVLVFLNYCLRLGQELMADDYAAARYGAGYMLQVLALMAVDFPGMRTQFQYRARCNALKVMLR